MVSADPSSIVISAELLPADGRFGCGPSKVRPEQVDAIVAAQHTILGTSHRKAPVKNLVGSVRAGLTDLFGLPDGWEVVLGNGGTTVFWDAATFGLIDARSQHLVFGEFSSKFAEAATAAPHLGEPTLISSATGTRPQAHAEDGVDLFALTHNETSTGVAEVDVYYFAPQKCFASDGGLWIAACSPAAVERIRRIGASDRWRPASIDLQIALDNSVQNQTYNTPALTTLVMLDAQIRWMNDNGGMAFTTQRSATSAATMYGWAEAREWATPFVAEPADRSAVVATIDLDDSISADDVCTALVANGVLDTFAYRTLGRNQLRIGMVPAIDPADIEALTHCIDHVVDALS